MKWINKKTHYISIARALGLSLATICILVLWFIFFRAAPTNIAPPPPKTTNIGLERMAKNPSSMDSLLKEYQAIHILDAIIQENLDFEAEEQLLRFAFGKNSIYWKDILSVLNKNKISVFWKEAGNNLTYRVLYIKNEDSSKKTLKDYLQKNPKFGISKGVIERISRKSNLEHQQLVMTYSEFWSVN